MRVRSAAFQSALLLPLSARLKPRGMLIRYAAVIYDVAALANCRTDDLYVARKIVLG